MKAIAIGVLLLSLQTASARVSAVSLAGTWKTTVVPGPGEMPAIAPSFTLAVLDGRVLVTFERQSKPEEAVVFGTGGGNATDNIAVLVIKHSSATSTRIVMLRPIAPSRIRCETYMEYPGERSKDNFYYAEVFRKSQ